MDFPKFYENKLFQDQRNASWTAFKAQCRGAGTQWAGMACHTNNIIGMASMGLCHTNISTTLQRVYCVFEYCSVISYIRQLDGPCLTTFWATACKTVRPMLSDRCLSVLSCLSVTLAYCNQTIGWIKMKLGVQCR